MEIVRSSPRPLLAVAALLCAGPAAATPVQYAGTGHYYEFVQTFGTHADAAAGASALAFLGATGHLATVASAGENAFLLALLPTNEIGWLGGEFQANVWAWIETGEGAFWNGTIPGTTVPGA